MIVKSSSPLSPAVTIRISGVEVDYTSIMGADLHLEEDKHDLLTIKMAGVPSRLILEYLDAPVTFFLDNGPGRSQLFVGYVSNVLPVAQTNAGFVNKSPFQQVDLVCVGASYYMKGLKSARWNPPTLDNVVSTMSKRYGFSADYPRDSYRPNNLVQTSESDWEFLVKTVNRYSHRVTVHGTHIHVWDVYAATGRASSYHELLSVNAQAGTQPCTIVKFDAHLGSLSSSGGASSSAVAYLDNQGRSHKVTSRDVRGSSLLGKQITSDFEDFVATTAQSFTEAQREVMRLDKADMPFSAFCQVSAGAGIVPGGIVNVLEYGSEFDGLWYVKSVRHSHVGSHYLTDLELAKDGLADINYEIAPVTKLAQPPDSLLIDGQWVAASRRVNQYV